MLSFVPGGSLVDAYGVATCQSHNIGIDVNDYGFQSIEDANKFDGHWLKIDGIENYPWT